MNKEINTKKKILGIIPARGGSKRLPHKNILPIAGKPLIAYTIESALKAPLDKVIVSTDSQEIADIAKKYGAEVPFLRPAEIAKDDTPDGPVFKHALEYLEKSGENYDYVVHLRPTTPLRNSKDIEDVIKKIVENNLDVVRSVTQAQGATHPYWIYRAQGNLIVPLFPEENISKYQQSQNLPKNFFLLNGVVDIYSKRHVLESEQLLVSESMGYIEIPRERMLDIDDELDLAIAELLMKRK